MKLQSMTQLLRPVVLMGAALALIGSTAIIADGHAQLLVSELTIVFVVFSVFFAIVTWLVVPHQPGNPVVWTMAAAAFFSGLFVAGLAAAALIVDDPVLVLEGAERVVPADLPTEATWILMVSEPSVVLATFPLLTFGLLMFPDGRVPSPPWRWVGWLSGLSLAAIVIVFAWSFRPTNTEQADASLVLDNAFVVLLLAVLLSLAALVVRYRGTSGELRQQFKWVVWGASVFGPVLVIAVSLGGTQYEDLATIPFVVATTVFVVSYGIAVGKYRLYDIDVIVSKSVTYLGLAAAITALYAAIVLSPLLVFGLPEEGGPGLALPIAATAVVALLFEPLRFRLQRWANRLVYGDRATPHEVLSQVTAQLSRTTSGSGTAELARLVAQGTGAEYAVVWLRSGDLLQPHGVWPAASPHQLEPIPPGEFPDDGFTDSKPILHSEEDLGALSITKPPSDPLTPADRELLTDVAAGAGLLLRNISLNRKLEERADQLRESRRRLIAAQDAERHRLERDLHDGAQQQVVALKVKLGIARTIAEREGAQEIVSLAEALADDTQAAVDALRRVARGIYPPLLEAEGLEIALRSVERSASDGLAIEINGLDRYSREVEATAYFFLVEVAEQARMSGSSFIRADLRDRTGELLIEIEHDGRTTKDELATVADRIDVLGGRTEVESFESLIRITSRVPTALELA